MFTALNFKNINNLHYLSLKAYMLDPQHSVEIRVTLSSVSPFFEMRNKEMNFKASICYFRVEGLAESPQRT
jgi:hypothetical protein